MFLQEHQWIAYLLALWAIPWKGIALWRSAKKGQFYWFIAFLIINTLGMLEILYIFVFSKMAEKKSSGTEAEKGGNGKSEIKIEKGETEEKGGEPVK